MLNSINAFSLSCCTKLVRFLTHPALSICQELSAQHNNRPAIQNRGPPSKIVVSGPWRALLDWQGQILRLSAITVLIDIQWWCMLCVRGHIKFLSRIQLVNLAIVS